MTPELTFFALVALVRGLRFSLRVALAYKQASVGAALSPRTQPVELSGLVRCRSRSLIRPEEGRV